MTPAALPISVSGRLLFALPNLGPEAGAVELLARGSVVDQLQRARYLIGDELPGAGGTVEEPLGRDDQPVLAGVEAVEAVACLPRGSVPQPQRAVQRCGPQA